MRGKRNIFKVGDKYGWLTIKESWTEPNINKKTRSRESICKCECRCGKEVVTQGRYLRSKHKQSCGCMQRCKGAANRNWKGHGDISSTFWNNISKLRRSRTIEFAITIEEAWSLFLKQGKQCALTGLPLKFPERSRYYDPMKCSASLDRINSSKGYTTDNVQWVHKIVNLMKFDLDQHQFIRWCRRIADHNPHVSATQDEDSHRPFIRSIQKNKTNIEKEKKKQLVLDLKKDPQFPTETKHRIPEFMRRTRMCKGSYYLYCRELRKEGRL